jgi:CRISPR-associated exonuclease Cas4
VSGWTRSYSSVKPLFPESDLLPISALQHLLYCPRQCALIHIERLWAENRLTVEGRHMHEKRAHARGGERRSGLRIERGLPLRSLRLGLFGQADVVEFHQDGVVFPIEYKRGRPKSHDADRVQLCAQALCLEEMLSASISAGAIFYGRTRRRLEVAFDPSLRQLTLQTIDALHELIATQQSPPARYEKTKCDRCSLRHLCLPNVLEGSESAMRYLSRSMAAVLASAGPQTDSTF